MVQQSYDKSRHMLTPYDSSVPLPVPDNRYALFLDIDGTLAPIAPTPAMATVPGRTKRILKRLLLSMDGAIALISGRSLMDIDRLLAPEVFSAAGQHGLEIRLRDFLMSSEYDNHGLMDRLTHEIMAFNIRHPRLLVEYKGMSIAVHYRNSPELVDEVDGFLKELCAACTPYVVFQKGKRVGEIRLSGIDKGKAIRQMLQVPPFAGRIPVFAGDDETDEDGFAAVSELGGITIKVGQGETMAHYRVDSTDQLQNWLESILTRLNTDPVQHEGI